MLVPFHKGPQWCRLGQFAKSYRAVCARAGHPWPSLHHSPVWAPSIHIIHSLWLWEGRGLAKVTKLVSCRAGAAPPRPQVWGLLPQRPEHLSVLRPQQSSGPHHALASVIGSLEPSSGNSCRPRAVSMDLSQSPWSGPLTPSG